MGRYASVAPAAVKKQRTYSFGGPMWLPGSNSRGWNAGIDSR